VAVTRARLKTIVVATHGVLCPPLAALADRGVERGHRFMTGVVAHASRRLDLAYDERGVLEHQQANQ
jgi:hypothetical protein